MEDKPTNKRTVQARLERRFEQVLSPFQYFIQDQTTSSILLIICTVAALFLANSPFAESYRMFIETPFGLVVGEYHLKMSLHHWINDALMTLFFFLLGLEIKRELLAGELQDRQSTLPVVAAAIGGMLFPALLFLSLNYGTSTAHGWGVPVATDTAFAVGILALLRRRIPASAFVFLTALAIFDDIGAIVVIAIFYTDTLNTLYLSAGAVVVLILMLFNGLGIRKPWVYLVGGVLVWGLFYRSGVHATVAGIIVALTVPARPKRGPGWFLGRIERLMTRFERNEQARDTEDKILGDVDHHNIVEDVQLAAEKASTPLRRWERALEQPVSLFVLPLFALANAGIPVNLNTLSALWNEALSGGIVLGMVLGKGLGIPLLTWVAIKLRLGRFPDGLTLRHLFGIGLLGGMGFTMSIFIADLAFDQPGQLLTAKSGILVASLVAGLAGWCWLRFFCGDNPESATPDGG